MIIKTITILINLTLIFGLVDLYGQQVEDHHDRLKLTNCFALLDELELKEINNSISKRGISLFEENVGFCCYQKEKFQNKDTSTYLLNKTYFIDAESLIRETSSHLVKPYKIQRSRELVLCDDSIYYESEYLKLRIASKSTDSLIDNFNQIAHEPTYKLLNGGTKRLPFHKRYWKINQDSSICVFLVYEASDFRSRKYDYLISFSNDGRKMKDFKRYSYIQNVDMNEMDSTIILFKDSENLTEITAMDIYHIQTLPLSFKYIVLKQWYQEYFITRKNNGKVDNIKKAFH